MHLFDSQGTIVTLDLTRQDSHHLQSGSKLRHHARDGTDVANTPLDQMARGVKGACAQN